ncbi:MAG TPA: energy transducer TonB [Pyrinomonadaceae bacterium]|nr:energy transducer TonB [Pyrinomonadaceae bacterium]
MKKISCSLIFIILFVCAIQAQTAESLTWIRIESDTKDFSIAVPSNYQVLEDEKGFENQYDVPKKRNLKVSNIRYVTAFENGASFLIESYKVNDLALGFWLFNLSKSNEKSAEFSFNEFSGRTFTKENSDSYTLEIIVGSKDRIYRIFGGARNQNNETLRHFFASLKLNDKKFFTLKSSLEEKIKETSALISTLPETPFTVEKGKKEDVKKTDEKSRNESAKKENKKLVLLYRPLARYTDAARNSNTQGKISLRITFAETGNIEKITILSGLSGGLTENAIRSARLIRFLPLEKDNKLTTTEKVVEYSFSIGGRI